MKRYIKNYSEIEKIQNDLADERNENYIYTGGVVPAELRPKIKYVTSNPNVTTMEWGAFRRCNNLRSVDLSNTSIEEIPAHAFFECGVLSEVYLPDSLKKIDYEAFAGCGNLGRLHIPNRVTRIGKSAFQDCFNITIITNSIEVIKYCNEHLISWESTHPSLDEYLYADPDTFGED